MKFKTIFFLFNGIILFSFLFIALMPLFVLGAEYTRIFWGENWFLALIFVIFISVLDSYFIINWRMFSLLEKEDWPGLTAYLEDEIYNKNKLNQRNIRMMVNTSLTISNLEKIIRLEKEISEKKPLFLGKFGTILGIPFLLNQNREEGKAFFRKCIEQAGDKDLPWLNWSYSFLLLSGRETDEASPLLANLTEQDGDSILKLLSMYLISTIPGMEDDQIQKQNKESFLQKYPTRKSLQSEITKTKNKNVVVLLLSSILDDSQVWIYGNETQSDIKE